MRSTGGWRRAVASCTIRRTRITASTAGRPTAGCAWLSATEVLVDTTDTMIVFETALEPRLYVAPSLVRTELLQRSETTSYCNYKGYATYWSAVLGDDIVEDVAWSYEEPQPETRPSEGISASTPTRPLSLRNCPRPRSEDPPFAESRMRAWYA